MSLQSASRVICFALAGIYLGSICNAQTTAVWRQKATRPPPEEPKFTSTAVEAEIENVTHKIAEPDIAWIFQAG